MDFREITLEDKKIFDKYVKNTENSSYNFTNMFIWTGNHNITYTVDNDCLFLRYKFGNAPETVSYPIGIGDKKQAIINMSRYLGGKGIHLVLRVLSEKAKKELEEMFPGKFTFVYDRDNSDYIYETKALIELKGRKYHSKRNHLNSFIENYNYVYQEFTPGILIECKQAFDSWMDEKSEDSELYTTRNATFKLIDNFKNLPLKGCVIRVDGKIIACSIGEPITPDMALIHVEYADPSYRGAFNIINQQFLINAWSEYKFVNREEDMGLEGLRKAKNSYRPVRLIDKYNAALNPGETL